MSQNNNQNLIWKNSTINPITRQMFSVHINSDTSYSYAKEDIFNTIFVRYPSATSSDVIPEVSDVLSVIDTPRVNDYFDFHVINASANTIHMVVPGSYVDNREVGSFAAGYTGKYRFIVSSDNTMEVRSVSN